MTIPFEEWNNHRHLLEEAVVDIESFFWFANRLLSHVALTLNYFFKTVKPGKIKGGVRSHSTLVGSSILSLLPSHLQQAARKLETHVSDFRNTKIEHSINYWRKRDPGCVTDFLPPDVHPEEPLRDLWILVHDYLTEVAKFLGSQLK